MLQTESESNNKNTQLVPKQDMSVPFYGNLPSFPTSLEVVFFL